MAWRIVIDRDLCQGHAACELEAPEIFQVPKNGTVEIKKERPTAEEMPSIREAVRYCPTGALSLRPIAGPDQLRDELTRLIAAGDVRPPVVRVEPASDDAAR
jgi:ferredoxin